MSFPSIVGEISSSGDELAAKVRKPYTITKQRERWTEEEHLKFLEALKLYGRAWRRIEEHIGTKTAVQIRSHAQKFFSKLVRGSSSRGVSSIEKAHDIEIPPPRPKRKPRHPYPRKAGSTQPTTKEGSTSPSAVSSTSLLSLGDKSSSKCVEFAPNDANARLNGQETKMDSTQMNGYPLSLKLFGQTMLVASAERLAFSTSKLSGTNKSQGALQEFVSAKQETTPMKTETEDHQMLENGNESLHTPGLDFHREEAMNYEVQSGSASNSVTSLERKAIMLTCDAVSSETKDSVEKQDSDEHLSSGQDANSSSFSRNQKLPATLPGCPRHIPVQCVVDGMVAENGHGDAKNWPRMTPLAHPTSTMRIAYGGTSLLPQVPPMFSWIKMQQGNTTVAEAVAAATAAAASAWLTFCGAVPPSFLHPSIFGTAAAALNPFFARQAESMVGATEYEGANIAEQEGENLFQGSHSENCTINLMKGFDDAQDHGENLSCQTEEQDQIMKDRELSNERSSSCSNTISSNDPEFEPYLGTNVEENTEVCIQGLHCNGGRCGSEEDSSKEDEWTQVSNNVKAEKHFHADVDNSISKDGGHCTKTQRGICNKGQTAFGSLFSQEVLPQSFSCEGELHPDLCGSIACEEQLYADIVNIQRLKSPCASSEKGIEDSEATMSHQLLEESVANFCKANKFIASSIRKSKSGVGFVPYQRCSVQANRSRIHSRSVDNSEDVLKEEKRICSKQ